MATDAYTKEYSNKIDRLVGERVKYKRKSLGMSQAFVGKKLGGITFQQVQKYERGVNRISCSSIYLLSKLFNVPVEYFFEGSDEIKLEYSLNNPSVLNYIPTTEEDRKRLKQEEKDIRMITKYLRRIRSSSLRKEAIRVVKTLSKVG